MRVLATIALALAAAPAFGFTPDRAAMMVDAVRANGCSMTGDQAPAALVPLGLDPVEVQAFVDVLHFGGLVTLSPDMAVLSLSEALCATTGAEALAMIEAAFAAQETSLVPWSPEFDPATGAAMIGAIRLADCALTDSRAAELLPPLGIDPGISRDIVAVLLETELAQITPDGTTLTLSDTLCAAAPADDLAAMEGAMAEWLARTGAQPEGDN